MYAFVHIEKTAGTTLNAILRRSFGVRHCDIRLPLSKRRFDNDDHRVHVDAADLRRVRRLYRNLRGIAGHNVKPYADLHRECPDIQFFTILRDPVSRFRSHFLNRAPGHTLEAFNRWIASDSVNNWQTKMIAGEPNSQKAIDLISARFGFVGFTERFDESLLLLRQWLQEPSFQVEYRSLNCISNKRRPRDAARHKSDMSYLDSPEVRARIEAANAEDQKVYDFVASTIYPRQLASYEGNLKSELRQLDERKNAVDRWAEPVSGSFMRNYIYKPLIH
ncbi:MAG TPA: sulfotransferase family 2 domain-containing protein, partial [Lacipirellulaceae bacterium]|nr:sulfotransferase family 2 domain-containing protein [Lacipirellulaceae bacterium]